MVWDAADPGRARVTVDTKTLRAAWGLVGGQAFDLGGCRFEVGPAERNYAAIWLASLDGRPVEESKRLLLVAAGSAQNEGMEWNDTRTSVANRWGKGPAQANGIPLTVALRTSARRVFALDGRGVRTAPVPAEEVGGTLRWSVGPAQKTLWYEIAVP